MSRGYLTGNEFKIHSFTVDVKRGVISDGDNKTQIEPKVMHVLLVLCEHSHQVVSQELIFEQVWPTSVFTPNSLRRCVAELRRALSDEKKELISTHPKVGYCLNANPEDCYSQADFPDKRQLFKFVAGGFITFTLVAMLLLPLLKEPFNPAHITEMKPITATESLEDFIAVSPNEKAIAFTRENSVNNRSLWIKDLIQEGEYSVGLNVKNIRNLAWDQKEDSIYYVEVTNQGWNIWRTNLNFDSHLLKHNIIVSNRNSEWISSISVYDDELYYIAKIGNSLSLYQHSLATSKQQILLKSNVQFKPYEFALNLANNEIAVSGQDDQGIAVVKFIALDAKRNINQIETLELGVKQRFSIELMSEKGEYLLNNGRQLFQLGKDGQISNLDFEHSQFIRFAKASKRSNNIYLVSSQLDTDFYIDKNGNLETQPIVNSNGMDYFPSISFDNQMLSFYSTRYGRPQLFIKDIETNETQILYENEESYLNVDRSVWSISGEQLAFSAGLNIFIAKVKPLTNKALRNLGVQGSVIAWYPDNKSLLIQQRNLEKNRLFKFDLISDSITEVGSYINGHVFMDIVGTVFLIKENKIELLKESNTSIIASQFETKIKRSIRHQQSLYLLFENSEFWFQWNMENGLVPTDFSFGNEANIATISADKSLAIRIGEKRQSDILKLSYK